MLGPIADGFLRLGVGIHSGSVLVGCIGSAMKMKCQAQELVGVQCVCVCVDECVCVYLFFTICLWTIDKLSLGHPIGAAGLASPEVGRSVSSFVQIVMFNFPLKAPSRPLGSVGPNRRRFFVLPRFGCIGDAMNLTSRLQGASVMVHSPQKKNGLNWPMACLHMSIVLSVVLYQACMHTRGIWC